MYAVIAAVLTSIASLIGIGTYDYLTYNDRVDQCISLTMQENPDLPVAKVKAACEIVTK